MFMVQWTYDGEAHQECPEASHWVGLDRSPRRHFMFSILSIVGKLHEITVDQELGVEGVLLVKGRVMDLADILDGRVGLFVEA